MPSAAAQATRLLHESSTFALQGIIAPQLLIAERKQAMAPATVLAPNPLKQGTSLDPQEPSFFAQVQLVPPSQQLRVYFSRLFGRELPRRSQLACSAHV